MTHTKTLLTAAALGATIAAAGAIPEVSAQGPTTLAYRGIETPRDGKAVDVRPKGESVGDRYLASVTLRADGAIAGRLEVECTAIDGTYEGHMCTAVAIVDDGMLMLQSAGVGRPIPGVGGTREVYAVTGGTGRYVDAGGRMTFDGDRILITLR